MAQEDFVIPAHISYCDINSTILFDFRGCMANSVEELTEIIEKEVRAVIGTNWPVGIDNSDIIVPYFKRIKTSSSGRISCDAIVAVTKRTSNRGVSVLRADA